MQADALLCPEIHGSSGLDGPDHRPVFVRHPGDRLVRWEDGGRKGAGSVTVFSIATHFVQCHPRLIGCHLYRIHCRPPPPLISPLSSHRLCSTRGVLAMFHGISWAYHKLNKDRARVAMSGEGGGASGGGGGGASGSGGGSASGRVGGAGDRDASGASGGAAAGAGGASAGDGLTSDRAGSVPSIPDAPCRVALVATGALTNVAVLLIMFPEVASMVDVYFMGGEWGWG